MCSLERDRWLADAARHPKVPVIPWSDSFLHFDGTVYVSVKMRSNERVWRERISIDVDAAVLRGADAARSDCF